jgi:hypothetical protein
MSGLDGFGPRSWARRYGLRLRLADLASAVQQHAHVGRRDVVVRGSEVEL